MHQPWMAAPLPHYFSDPLFFTRTALAQELDIDPLLLRHSFSIISNRITQGFGKTGIIEDANVLFFQEARHPRRITQLWQRSQNDQAIVAGDSASNLVLITFCEQHSIVLPSVFEVDDRAPQLPLTT